METKFKIFQTEYENQIYNLQEYYGSYKSIQNKFDLKKELNKFPKYETSLYNNTEDEFRLILSRFRGLSTYKELKYYCLEQAKVIYDSFGIFNSILSSLVQIKDKEINNDKKRELYSKNKEFKERYTQEKVYEILIEEIKRICEVNGIIQETS